MRASSNQITGGHVMLFAASLGLVTAGSTQMLGAEWYLVLPFAFLAIFVCAIATLALEAERRPAAVAFGALLFPVAMWAFSLIALVGTKIAPVAWGCLAFAAVPVFMLIASFVRPRTARAGRRQDAPALSPAE